MTKHSHVTKTCQCCYCKAKRARIAKVHAAMHSKVTHAAIFLAVPFLAVGLSHLHIGEGLGIGAVLSKGIDLCADVIADRMLPPELLRG